MDRWGEAAWKGPLISWGRCQGGGGGRSTWSPGRLSRSEQEGGKETEEGATKERGVVEGVAWEEPDRSYVSA